VLDVWQLGQQWQVSRWHADAVQAAVDSCAPAAAHSLHINTLVWDLLQDVT
jgi:hypothetical protein